MVLEHLFDAGDDPQDLVPGLAVEKGDEHEKVAHRAAILEVGGRAPPQGAGGSPLGRVHGYPGQALGFVSITHGLYRLSRVLKLC
ncbi:MAG: hypothetical protein U5S82_09170 [Gammaproteobacteria bacterium]|nr:hypothetical protein [Gammaproteobacteria bacterium]